MSAGSVIFSWSASTSAPVTVTTHLRVTAPSRLTALMVAFPALTPVTLPIPSTMATRGAELVHVKYDSSTVSPIMARESSSPHLTLADVTESLTVPAAISAMSLNLVFEKL